ncbi:MAG: DUF192 domain-containing protein [Gammaproteobacteria bacterium]|nr:DUF192 domain-containing protein [Gammaproteobacteria bacterium]
MRSARLSCDGRSLPLQVLVCEGVLERARGLLGRSPLGAHGVLWIAPCCAIHTFGLRQPIDVVFCDRTGRVLTPAATIARRRFAWTWRARIALESQAGTLVRLGLAPGQALHVR